VGKLVEMGLIVRAADPVDLRRFELRLTPEGERRRERVREVAERVVGEHFGHLPPERLAQARRALEDLHAALEGAGENAP
jgi:DNA-binding MarR family transcriptional regulator